MQCFNRGSKAEPFDSLTWAYILWGTDLDLVRVGHMLYPSLCLSVVCYSSSRSPSLQSWGDCTLAFIRARPLATALCAGAATPSSEMLHRAPAILLHLTQWTLLPQRRSGSSVSDSEEWKWPHDDNGGGVVFSLHCPRPLCGFFSPNRSALSHTQRHHHPTVFTMKSSTSL